MKILSQGGIAHIFLLLAVLGLLLFLLISNTFSFRDRIFSNLFPKPPSLAATSLEWTQDGGNAQRTGYIPEEPDEPWTYLWSFNGPDATGGVGNHFYNAPHEARTVVGGENIYVPAGIHGLYALNISNGMQVWRINPVGVRFNATAAYDSATGYVYAGGSDGNLYKVSPAGATQTYNTGNPVNKSVLLVGSFAYIVTDNGQLHKVDTSGMTQVWTYQATSTVATLPSYSASRDIIIFATDDLFVHAVNNNSGIQKWRVKPSPNTPGGGTLTYGGTPTGSQFERGWPVIADKSGVVLVRMQLNHNDMTVGPNSGIFDTTNSANRAWLQANPQYRDSFALNLDDGSEKFIPVTGYGTTEDYLGTAAYGVMGTQPVVKELTNGKEVAYMIFRNGQSYPPSDYRWSGHMGEMVFDNTTVPGLSAGDFRFIKMALLHQYSTGGSGNSYVNIIDTQNPLIVAGDTIYFAHWSASTSVKITNRSDSLGLIFDNPIQTSPHPPVVRALRAVSCKDTSTHWTGSCTNLNYVTDGGNYYGGPGWWVYWDIADPPGWIYDQAKADSGGSTGAGTAYSAGFLPRYTYVSNGYMIVEGNGGELTVFRHSGTVPTPTPGATSSPTPSPSSTSPNIVVIMTDDQDAASISVMTKVKTLLADKGITFTNSFVDNSLCCPSRATFLTGQASHNSGIFMNAPPDGGYAKLHTTLNNSLPVWLQNAGYNTAHIGKMPNGYGTEVPSTTIPPGWDTFKGLIDPFTYRYSNYQLNENGVLNTYNNCPDPVTNCPDYQTDVLSQKAVAYINSRAGNPQPFFLSVASLAPHVEYPAQPNPLPRPAPRHLGTFGSLPIPTPPSFNEADVSDKPSFISSDPLMDATTISMTQTHFQKRRESLLAVDDMVESIVNALQASGKLNDTVIIFTSDNGFFHGEHRQPATKLLLYEESIRVPLIISGKGIPLGQTRGQLVNNIDIPATIVELAQATAGRTLDGRSLIPLFQDPGASWRSALLVQGSDDPLPDEIARYKAVRTNRYIYGEHTLLAGGVEKELYDLTADPYQLESKHADPAYVGVTSGLQSMLGTLGSCVGASCWMTTPEPSPSPKVGDINGDGAVNVVDFSIMLSKWGTSDAGADLNGDGIVNVVDFSILLSNWGS